MRKIRKSLFETNSSSTHSIVIANNGNDCFKEHLPEKLVFDTDEFGWEWDRYDDVQNRANYLFTALLYNVWADEYFPFVLDTLKKWNIEVEYPPFHMNDKGYYEFDDPKHDDFYYIDHGSQLEGFIKEVCTDETLLMNYLFSDESFIATGNDNEDLELDDSTSAKNVLLEYYKGN
jgi:hypothetical protein